jgi:hypothetical protein
LGTATEIDMAGDNSSSQAPFREGWSTDSGHRDQAVAEFSRRSASAPVPARVADIEALELVMSFLRRRTRPAMGLA